jgi:hypothetical protein
MSRTTQDDPERTVGGDWSKIGSADAFVTAAGERLIGSECGSIIS